MSPFCSQCGLQQPEAARFCSACGTSLSGEVPQTGALTGDAPPRSTEMKEAGALAKTGGALLGCGIGVWIGVAMILVGLVLSATGIGMIIGIPLILVGLVFPFLAPFIGLAMVTGSCPYCASSVTAFGGAFNCATCKKRIIIKNKRFVRVD